MTESNSTLTFVINFGALVVGYIINEIKSFLRNRFQKMHCYYIEDDVVSKVPTIGEGESYANICSKKFKLVNTTNKDHKKFKLRLKFHDATIVLKAQSVYKEIINHYKYDISGCHVTFTINNFNRKEFVVIDIELGNITVDDCQVVCLENLGFDVKVFDKRKSKAPSKVKLH